MAGVRTIKFQGRSFRIQHPLGAGGQGEVFLARSDEAQAASAIVKALPDTPAQRRRLDYWFSQRLGERIPGLSAPLRPADRHRKQQLWYLALHADGVPLDEDRPRALPQLLEMAIVLTAVWERLERLGIAHGDIAPSNVLVADDGEVMLIDVDNFACRDKGVPPPAMIGQHAMLAPELRRERNRQAKTQAVFPTLESDRFAWGVLLSLCLLGRHPADGLTQTPAAFDALMMSGRWPEARRRPQTDEIPVAVLGSGLRRLFGEAFSTDPAKRPEARQWRLALMEALAQLHIHRCGGAFVVEREKGRCPWCGKQYRAVITNQTRSVRVRLKNLLTGASATYDWPEGTFLYLGRDNLPDASPYVSTRHLRLYRQNGRVHLEHVGKNPTLMRFDQRGKLYQLDSFWEDLDSKDLRNLGMTMADTPLVLELIRK